MEPYTPKQLEHQEQFSYEGPIGSILFLSETTLLAAQGPNLLVYDLNKKGDESLAFKKQLVQSSLKICGLSLLTSFKAGRLCVLGEKSFMILHEDTFKVTYDHGSRSLDKIIQVISISPTHLAILHAHNYVEIVDSE